MGEDVPYNMNIMNSQKYFGIQLAKHDTEWNVKITKRGNPFIHGCSVV